LPVGAIAITVVYSGIFRQLREITEGPGRRLAGPYNAAIATAMD